MLPATAVQRHSERSIWMPTAFNQEASWTMVWCHERCHKPDSEAFRRELAESVEHMQGNLVLLRKACGLERWTAEAPSAPWILLTDWREAKPSVQFLCGSTLARQPDMIVVYTDGERQSRRSAGWCRELPEAFRNQVCIVPMPALAIPVIQGLRLGAATATASMQPSRQVCVRLSLSSLLEDKQVEEGDRPESVCSHGDSTCSTALYSEDSLQRCVSTASTSPVYNSNFGCWNKAVANFMMPLVCSTSIADLTQMLTQAMPERYED